MENINKFVAAAQDIINNYYAKNYPSLTPKTLTVQVATKYVKVWNSRAGVSESIHSFINPQTGEVFMPASTKAPAKHARGNVNSPTNGTEALTESGSVRYL